MQGLSIEECKKEKFVTDSCVCDGYASQPVIYQTKDVFDECVTEKMPESYNRWLDDYGWL